MNDSLLESQVRPRKHLSVEGLRPSEPQTSMSPEPNRETEGNAAYKILMLDRQAKINVTLNNIFMILFLNLVPFGLILSTIPNMKWFLLKTSNNYDYWVNFLFVQELSSGSETTYALIRCFFSPDSCTFNNPVKLLGFTQTMKSYAIAGFVSIVTVLLGLLLHIAHFYQMIAISCTRNPNRIKGFSVITIAYFTIFMYSGSLVYWIFASGAIIDPNVPEKNFFHRVSSSLLCYVIGIVIFILLVLWFSAIYKKGVRKNLVNDLLNAEKKYVDEVDDDSDEDVCKYIYSLKLIFKLV